MMTLEQSLHRGYELLAPLARVSLQHGQTSGRSLSWVVTKEKVKGQASLRIPVLLMVRVKVHN